MSIAGDYVTLCHHCMLAPPLVWGDRVRRTDPTSSSRLHAQYVVTEEHKKSAVAEGKMHIYVGLHCEKFGDRALRRCWLERCHD